MYNLRHRRLSRLRVRHVLHTSEIVSNVLASQCERMISAISIGSLLKKSTEPKGNEKYFSKEVG